jgi:hypothetical protein
MDVGDQRKAHDEPDTTIISSPTEMNVSLTKRHSSRPPRLKFEVTTLGVRGFVDVTPPNRRRGRATEQARRTRAFARFASLSVRRLVCSFSIFRRSLNERTRTPSHLAEDIGVGQAGDNRARTKAR